MTNRAANNILEARWKLFVRWFEYMVQITVMALISVFAPFSEDYRRALK